MDEDDEQVEEKLTEELATFEEFTVWDHEALLAAEDPYVMGVEEWIALAEVVGSSTGIKVYY